MAKTLTSSRKRSSRAVQPSDRFVSLWEKTEDPNKQNDELDSFLAGRETGLNESRRILSNQLHKNIEHAQEASEKLFEQLIELKLKPKSVHVKSELISVFQALVVVELEAFLSDDFSKAFSVARDISKKEENKNFYISFTFMADSPNVNYECMSSDGYFLRYEGKEIKKRRSKASARPA